MRNSSTLVHVITFALAHCALAGDTTPPPGPVAATMKTLTQVEPRTPLNTLPGDANTMIVISQPGSYYLTSDIVATGNKDGIRVAADSVTIDLNGFRLVGQGHLPSVGIVTSGNRKGCTIRNGTLTGWGYGTLNLGGFMTHSLFEDLVLTNNPAGGLEQAGVDHSIFRNIRVQGQGEVGIAMGDNCVMTGCVVEGSFTGISGVFNCSVLDCTVLDCDQGITLFGNGVIERCSARNCNEALYIGYAGAIRNCSVSGGEIAIQTKGFASVESCVVSFASVEGIRLVQKDLVRNNQISNCPIAIRAGAPLGVRSVIDANSVTACPVGIQVPSPGNTVTRNIVTDASTAAFDIVPGNAVGTIQPTPVGAGAWDNLAH